MSAAWGRLSKREVTGQWLCAEAILAAHVTFLPEVPLDAQRGAYHSRWMVTEAMLACDPVLYTVEICLEYPSSQIIRNESINVSTLGTRCVHRFA